MNVTAKFNFTKAQVDTAMDEACKREGARYKVKGFRDGNAPRGMIEKEYGDVFTEPAFNALFNKAFSKYLEGNPNVTPLDDPEVDISQKPDGIEFIAVIPVQDKFTLGKYTGLEINSKTIKVTDKEVDGFLARVAGGRTRQIAADKGHKIANGNIAVIDFTGFVDGKKFAGGEAKNHELEIGSHSFIDTFEEQLVGKTVGDKLDVNVTFPKDYHAKELAGAKSVFKVEIRNILIREIPAIDDNLAKESSEFNTLAEFKKDIRARLEKQSKIESDKLNEQELLRVICDNTKVDVHDKLVARYFHQIMHDTQQSLAQSGYTLEMYATAIGSTVEKIEKIQRNNAQNSAKVALILDAIAKKENLKDFDSVIKFLETHNKLKEAK
ncbi:MAG: trigger factor [Christensenellaceae bacterium]|jgi:trigger factor|nr:trigger factor [Christensenellaceae bacterium]